jgi:hypothetical protein
MALMRNQFQEGRVVSMGTKRVSLWVRVATLPVVLAIGFSPSALAQGETILKRIEFSGSAGWSGLTDKLGTLGTGTNTAGGVAFYVVPSVAVGVEVNRTVHSGFLPLQDQFRRSDGRVTFKLVNASYYFVHGNVLGLPIAPYVTGGAGVVRVRRADRYLQTVILPSGQFSSGPNYSEQLLHEDDIMKDEGAFNIGAGIDFGFVSHFSLRPEFRLFEASSQKMVRGSLVLAFRW